MRSANSSGILAVHDSVTLTLFDSPQSTRGNFPQVSPVFASVRHIEYRARYGGSEREGWHPTGRVHVYSTVNVGKVRLGGLCFRAGVATGLSAGEHNAAPVRILNRPW
jgi:hypothetical protein